jgi:16S rRNA U516 pseudouridylate synthase RsuA-like enzyme
MGEGRKREVRRLFAAIGIEVRDLVRTAVGPLQLGDLPEGEGRPLRAGELSSLRAAAGLPAASRASGRPRSARPSR